MKTNFATSTLPYRENEVRSSKRQGGEARLSPPPLPAEPLTTANFKMKLPK